jgi:hypothetical protein
VARALGRAAVGHAVLFQDAVHALQKTSAAIMRTGSPGDIARSAPVGGGTTAGSGSISDGSLCQSSASLGKASQAGSSPGVRLREDLAYEPMLHIGLDQTSLGKYFLPAFILLYTQLISRERNSRGRHILNRRWHFCICGRGKSRRRTLSISSRGTMYSCHGS